MITRTVKIQLLIFVAMTLLGVSYVGAKYAQLDRMFWDDRYTVSVQLAESGGIFVGAEVTYRGITVGRVEKLTVTDTGVRVDLGIDNGFEDIPADADALIANRSAIGEQYVDLQPRSDDGPYLREGSVIARSRTETPISTRTLLTDLDSLVRSVDRGDLRTVVSELGTAFRGTGPDLGTIIDNSNSFIEVANRHFGNTASLIRNSRVALQTQIASRSHLRTFARNLRLFSATLAAEDPTLRKVIDDGSVTARDVRRLIEENDEEIVALINNVVTLNEIVVVNIDGLEQVLVLYPWVVEGGYTVVTKDPFTGLYDARFGLVLSPNPPVCTGGYTTEHRSPHNLEEVPFNTSARCTEPASVSNARGAQNAPGYRRGPYVAAYDPATGELTPTASDPDGDTYALGDQDDVLGEESWKWLLLDPLAPAGR